MNTEYFIKQDNLILVNVPYIEAYIHEELFTDEARKSSLVYNYGDGYKMIGEFNVRIFDREEVENRYAYPLKTFNYPNTIETFPSEIIKCQLSIDGKSEPEKIRIFKYFKGDTIMDATSKKDSQNCELYIDLICKGKIPTSIPYDKLNEIWNKNFEINDISPGIPAVTLEAMIAVLSRCKDNPLIPFRKIAGKDPNYNKTDYYAANMRETTSFTNVMSSLTFEDLGSMLATALNISMTNTPQSRSPFEDLLSM